MTPRRAGGRDRAAWAVLLGLLVAAGLMRPLLPIDETRYAAVAWEMWWRGDLLVPVLNGEPYPHKPPLLFWLIHAGWAVLGVNEVWPRLIAPLCAAGTMALAHRLALRLWPGRPDTATAVPYLLIATPLFAYFATALMFDMMLSFFVALGLFGVVTAWRDGGRRGFFLLAIGIGGALHAKGPVGFVHLLPAALFAPWWMREGRPPWRRWYLGVTAATLGGAVLILAWAVPAALTGGTAYGRAIFLGQTAGRMVDSFAHRAPWYAYLAGLPLILAPWFLWPRAWGRPRGAGGDSGWRFALLCTGFALVFFSAVSGKRWQYLLPEFTAAALLLARRLTERESAGRRWLALPALQLLLAGLAAAGVAWASGLPRFEATLAPLGDVRGLWIAAAVACAAAVFVVARAASSTIADVRAVAAATVVVTASLLAAGDVAMREAYELRAVAAALSRFEREGRPVAYNERYHGQWTLAGRLRRPLEEIASADAAAWLAAHPNGRLVFVHRDPDAVLPGRLLHRQRYRGTWLAIVQPG